MVNEIESHNGLILQSGNDRFEFAHKSLQEFLTAEYIHGLEEIPSNKDLILSIPNELAIATTLASNQSSFFSKLILTRLKPEGFNSNFMNPYLTRLFSEKPDFVVSDFFGIACLYIYSAFVLNNSSADNFSSFSKSKPIKTAGKSPHQKQEGAAESNDQSNSEKLPQSFSTFELELLIKQLFQMEECKESLRILKKLYRIEGDRFSLSYSKSDRFYLLQSASVVKGEKKSIFPKSIVINEDLKDFFKE